MGKGKTTESLPKKELRWKWKGKLRNSREERMKSCRKTVSHICAIFITRYFHTSLLLNIILFPNVATRKQDDDEWEKRI